MASSRYSSLYDKKKSAFSFEDEFGSDPLLRRYGPSPSIARGYAAAADVESARRVEAESELALAQAEEEAKLAPLKAVSERFRLITNLTDQRTKLEENAKTQTEVVQANQRLKDASSIDDLVAIDMDLPNAQLSPEYGRSYSSKLAGFRNAALAQYAQSLNAAKTEDEVVAAKASLHVLFLADDAFNRNVSNLDKAATARVQAMRSTQAAAAVSRATGTQESLDARMQYADVLSDPKVQAASEMAGRQSSAMRGLTQLGVEAMPVTQDGRFDIDRAENIVETLGQTDIRTLSAAQRGIQKQLEDPMLDPDGPEAKALQSDLTNINRQIAGITNRSNQQTTRAAMDLESLGGTNPDWIDTLIDGGGGGGGGATAAPPVTTPGSAPTPKPSTPNSSAPVSSGGRSADAKNKQSGTDASPKPFEATAQQLAAAELAYTRASQASPAPGVVPLSDQPPGIRQINEAVAYPYTEAREAKAKVSQLKKQLQPFENYDTGDPQDVQNAISIVYPEIDSKGSLQRKFDVGKSDDPQVAFAAEFLQKVEKENPGFVRRMAASPGPGGERGQLTLEEVPELAAAADKFRNKRRSARGTKN